MHRYFAYVYSNTIFFLVRRPSILDICCDVAVCCSVLQCNVRFTNLSYLCFYIFVHLHIRVHIQYNIHDRFQHSATAFSTWHVFMNTYTEFLCAHTAPHSTALQYAATHCNTHLTTTGVYARDRVYVWGGYD